MTDDILVLRALGLGDLLTAVPALRGLRRAYPGARITVATPEPLQELAQLTGAVDAVLPTPGLGHLSAGSTRPTLAVNLHGRGPQSIADLRRTRPQRLLTHAHPDHPEYFGPSWPTDCHEVDRWCAMLEWFGIACDPQDLRMTSPRRSWLHTGSVILHPGASAMSRRWPAHRYVAVAAELRNRGAEVLVTGDQSEVLLAEFVAARAGLPPSAVLAGKLTVTELMALIEDAQLLICGDTGVAHIATATGTPSVLLFGPTAPHHWGPRTGGAHTVLWRGRIGDPHGDSPDRGLLEITTTDVLAAAEPALRSRV
jgi:ADP-heptose:LPS heptosyltransferase